jgi:hypothetical protein
MAKRIECLRVFMGFNEWLEEEEKDCSFFLVRFNDGQKKRRRVYMCFLMGFGHDQN